MAADTPLARLRADARHLAPDPPGLNEVTEDAGRQRLAAYYLYSALLAAVTGDLAPALWPPQLAEPVNRLGLTRFTPRTWRGLDAQLTPAEQATRRSPARQLEFAQLLVDLVNKGAFGPLCGDADHVRLSGNGLDLELIKGRQVVGACPASDHWELMAQHLAGAPLGGPPAQARAIRESARTAARRLANHAIPDAVSAGVTLAVHLHPIGTIAGLGTRLIRSRIQAGQDQADALHRLGQELRTLRARSDGELADLRPQT
jgi:hypothetical protein